MTSIQVNNNQPSTLPHACVHPYKRREKERNPHISLFLLFSSECMSLVLKAEACELKYNFSPFFNAMISNNKQNTSDFGSIKWIFLFSCSIKFPINLSIKYSIMYKMTLLCGTLFIYCTFICILISLSLSLSLSFSLCVCVCVCFAVLFDFLFLRCFVQFYYLGEYGMHGFIGGGALC